MKILSFPNPNTLALSIRAKALVFNDPSSQKILDHMEQIAPSEATVLIIGETGTGKELVARYIHERSGRTGPFIAVNCGAFSENLVEAELFGHETGAYTGAQQARQGWFEAAQGGTLFLDEIGDMSLAVQVKLLRVLQERQVVRIGARKPISIDVRLIAATNVELERAVEAERFRRDLYYRINVAPVALPPLRERRGDILPLAEYFLQTYATRLDRPVQQLHDSARRVLLEYSWPGNIRELENVIHFALLVSSGGQIRPEHLRISGGLSIRVSDNDDSTPPFEVIGRQLGRIFDSPVGQAFEKLERQIINTAFVHARYNQVRTAEILGVTRNVVRTLLKRHGLIGDETPDSQSGNTTLPLHIGPGPDMEHV